jgi:ORF6N domain
VTSNFTEVNIQKYKIDLIMAKTTKALMIPDELVMNKIYLIRSLKVMLDRDLAELYGVETKRLKEAVRRNIHRFPEDFMFEMTLEELENWRTQFATSNSEKMGLRRPPFCFTEQGVAMLSSVLNSETAIAVNIQIIRVFTRMRELLLTHKDILLQLEKMEKKLTGHDEHIALIFQYLKKLLNPPQPPRQKIGFKRKDEQ